MNKRQREKRSDFDVAHCRSAYFFYTAAHCSIKRTFAIHRHADRDSFPWEKKIRKRRKRTPQQNPRSVVKLVHNWDDAGSCYEPCRACPICMVPTALDHTRTHTTSHPPACLSWLPYFSPLSLSPPLYGIWRYRKQVFSSSCYFLFFFILFFALEFFIETFFFITTYVTPKKKRLAGREARGETHWHTRSLALSPFRSPFDSLCQLSFYLLYCYCKQQRKNNQCAL